MQIPIINGIYTNEAPDFRIAYPRNMMPVAKQQGISAGYLRPADGIVQVAVGPGVNRGGISWNGVHYRVMGTRLVNISDSGTITDFGEILGVDHVTFDYSFDYLSISANGSLYLFDGVILQQVTDPDLRTVVDHIWVDGYFMTTDGEFLVVTELNNPFSVLPTKYGSSEADPDPVKAIIKLRNEPYVLNRHTIEAFSDIGGTGFPFQRIDGAQIQRGAVGTQACCLFFDSIAFVGGGRNEAIGVYLAANGSSIPISTDEINRILETYDEDTLSQIVVEPRVDKSFRLLMIHLPDQTLVYDDNASRAIETPVWFVLSSGISESKYRARDLVRAYNRWWVGDTETGAIGYLTDSISTHWGNTVGWEFSTAIIYNEGTGAIFHELELVALTGRTPPGVNPTIYTQYSVDGETWSVPKYINAGMRGDRLKRLVWLGQGAMEQWRIQRFAGTSEAQFSVARLEARIEPLAV